MITKYYAKIQNKDGVNSTYEVYDVEETRKILKSLENKEVTPNDIWAIVYDYDDDFYNKSNCALIVNERHVSDEQMYKAGYAKVVKFTKCVQVWEETQIF